MKKLIRKKAYLFLFLLIGTLMDNHLVGIRNVFASDQGISGQETKSEFSPVYRKLLMSIRNIYVSGKPATDDANEENLDKLIDTIQETLTRFGTNPNAKYWQDDPDIYADYSIDESDEEEVKDPFSEFDFSDQEKLVIPIAIQNIIKERILKDPEFYDKFLAYDPDDADIDELKGIYDELFNTILYSDTTQEDGGLVQSMVDFKMEEWEPIDNFLNIIRKDLIKYPYLNKDPFVSDLEKILKLYFQYLPLPEKLRNFAEILKEVDDINETNIVNKLFKNFPPMVIKLFQRAQQRFPDESNTVAVLRALDNDPIIVSLEDLMPDWEEYCRSQGLDPKIYKLVKIIRSASMGVIGIIEKNDRPYKILKSMRMHMDEMHGDFGEEAIVRNILKYHGHELSPSTKQFMIEQHRGIDPETNLGEERNNILTACKKMGVCRDKATGTAVKVVGMSDEFEELVEPDNPIHRRVMVMDIAEGAEFADILKGKDMKAKLALYKSMPTFYKHFLRIALKNGWIHGDLHPGNAFVKGNRITIIDFGKFDQIPGFVRNSLVQIYLDTDSKLRKKPIAKGARSYEAFQRIGHVFRTIIVGQIEQDPGHLEGIDKKKYIELVNETIEIMFSRDFSKKRDAFTQKLKAIEKNNQGKVIADVANAIRQTCTGNTYNVFSQLYNDQKVSDSEMVEKMIELFKSNNMAIPDTIGFFAKSKQLLENFDKNLYNEVKAEIKKKEIHDLKAMSHEIAKDVTRTFQKDRTKKASNITKDKAHTTKERTKTKTKKVMQ